MSRRIGTRRQRVVRSNGGGIAKLIVRRQNGDWSILVSQLPIEGADALFATPPRIVRLDVLADKLPAAMPAEPVTRGCC